MKFRKSKFGFILIGIFVALAMAALFLHLYSVKSNTGDSGESAIILLPFAAPWIFWIPSSVAYSKFWGQWAYLFYCIFVSINALILYILAGGLKWER